MMTIIWQQNGVAKRKVVWGPRRAIAFARNLHFEGKVERYDTVVVLGMGKIMFV